MRYPKILLLPVFALCMTGCDKVKQLTSTSCSDASGVAVATSIIKDAVEKQLKNQKNDEGTSAFDLAAIRATLSKMTLSFESIRTSKTDPNSTKVFCTANAKVVLPVDFMNTANSSFSTIDGDNARTVSVIASKYELTTNANAFSKDLDYDLQPTDDGKSIFAEVQEENALSNFMQEVADAVLEKPIIEAQRAREAKAVADAKQQQASMQAQANQQNEQAQNQISQEQQVDQAQFNQQTVDNQRQLADQQSKIQQQVSRFMNN